MSDPIANTPPDDPPPARTWTSCEVIDRELDYVVNRRRRLSCAPERWDEAPTEKERAQVKDDLVGLALSGGGIRSATTNLGILQALAQMRILPLVDYLSTVSGGGCIGSCLSSLLSLNTQRAHDLDGEVTSACFSTEAEQFPFSDHRPAKDPSTTPRPLECFTGVEQVAHLRTHGNFLIARRGVFRRDALRAVGNLLSGVVVSVLVVLIALLVVAGVVMVTAEWLAPGLQDRLGVGAPGVGLVAQMRIVWRQLVGELGTLWNTVATGAVPWAVLLPLAVGAGLSPIILLMFVVWPPNESSAQSGESAEEWRERWLLRISAAGLIAAVIVTAFLARYWEGLAAPVSILWLLLPAVVLLGARVTSFLIALVRPLFPGWDRGARSLWGVYQAITTYGLVALLALGLLPLAAHPVARAGLGSAVAIVSMVVSRLLAGGGQPRLRLPPVLVKPVLALAVGLFFVFAVLAWAIVLIRLTRGHNELVLLVTVTVAAVVALVVVGFAVNFNKVSLHYFYRDRLAETYLRTQGVSDGTLRPLRDSIELALKALHGTANKKPRSSAPYQLINTAMNLAASRDLTRKDRKSGYFSFLSSSAARSGPAIDPRTAIVAARPSLRARSRSRAPPPAPAWAITRSSPRRSPPRCSTCGLATGWRTQRTTGASHGVKMVSSGRAIS